MDQVSGEKETIFPELFDHQSIWCSWFFNILLHHILWYAFNSFLGGHRSSKFLCWDVFCFDLFTKSVTKFFFCKFFTCYYNGCLSVENYQVVCLSNIWVTTVVQRRKGDFITNLVKIMIFMLPISVSSLFLQERIEIPSFLIVTFGLSCS